MKNRFALSLFSAVLLMTLFSASCAAENNGLLGLFKPKSSTELSQTAETSVPESPVPTSVPEPVSIPVLTPAPTAVPEVVILGKEYNTEKTFDLDLSMLESSAVEETAKSVAELKNLKKINLVDTDGKCNISFEEYVMLAEAAPAAVINYEFELFGQTVNTALTNRLEYLRTEIGDEGLERFRETVPYLPELKYISFDRCNTSDEACAKLRDDFAGKTEIVWRIFFSPFSCMTDVETIWASVDLRDSQCGALKYCTKLKNLDIGHSAMKELSFLDYMPDLEVLIIACSDFDDISHVANCRKLKYFECAECIWLKDLSPICELKELEHLNIGGCNSVEDISCLYSLTECKNLKRFYAQNMIKVKNIQEEEEKFRELLPEVEMDFNMYPGMGSLNMGFWRHSRGNYEGHPVEAYQRIRDIFGYSDPSNQARLWN